MIKSFVPAPFSAFAARNALGLLGLAAALLLAGCGVFGKSSPSGRMTPADLHGAEVPAASASSSSPAAPAGAAQPSAPRISGSVGVNGYLWRASLDTLRFMPLASADPIGGTIITDWFSPPETPGERFKANVYILDRQLRADALRVSVFHQTRDKTGQWADAAVDPATNGKVENAILTRARQLRLATTEKN
ncbi:MAG: DUF3576 domain-containing protein [Alphaproteobacteria bacterium]